VNPIKVHSTLSEPYNLSVLLNKSLKNQIVKNNTEGCISS
jgi:hypothetical protein